MAVDALTGNLGANPIEMVLNRLGFWTLTFLALSLIPTPVHDWLHVAWPIKVRRMLGLFAFAYATLHMLWYAGVDQLFDLHLLAEDATKRKFMAVGFIAWLFLVPLAVTSTDGWVRRLGYLRWKRLHRLAYVVAVLGTIHFFWREKADTSRPFLFAAVFGLLFLVRAVTYFRSQTS
ncbi:MAG: sulfoxide reductase heme-binding subunit YedZ [Polyangiaceae bacterium]|nr:sulfoxide reductase heme-binding subunit YedZ [Polyangiaceae bacterium]